MLNPKEYLMTVEDDGTVAVKRLGGNFGLIESKEEKEKDNW